MGLSLEERKRKLIEDVCASSAGGGGTEVTGGTDTGEGMGDPDNFVKALAMIRKKRKKDEKKHEKGDGA